MSTNLRFPHPLEWWVELYVDEHGSITKAAKSLGVTRQYVWRLMKGHQSNPSDEIMDKLGLSLKRYYIRK
jgi:hypothetical protein